MHPLGRATSLAHVVGDMTLMTRNAKLTRRGTLQALKFKKLQDGRRDGLPQQSILHKDYGIGIAPTEQDEIALSVIQVDCCTEYPNQWLFPRFSENSAEVGPGGGAVPDVLDIPTYSSRSTGMYSKQHSGSDNPQPCKINTLRWTPIRRKCTVRKYIFDP